MINGMRSALHLYNMFKTKMSKSPGFSLIELLIASSIVFFLILSTAQMTIQAIYLKARSAAGLRSAELAVEKLERFKAVPFDNPDLKKAGGEEKIFTAMPLRQYLRRWSIMKIDPDTKLIEVECYEKNFPQKKARTVLYITREPGL